MLIAPLLQQGVPVTLPPADNTEDKADNDQQTILHIDAQGRFYVDTIPTDETQLLTAIQSALDRKLERIVLIKGDEAAQYSEVMAVLDQLQRAGIENIGLITEKTLESGRGD